MRASNGESGRNSTARERERLRELELFTEGRRLARAGHHYEQALKAERESTAAWHRGRARGQRKRFDNIELCGDYRLKRRCRACHGVASEVCSLTCGIWRLCKACRARYQRWYRARFTLARKRYLDFVGLPAGCSEKFLTLTIPHIDPVQDAETLARSWRRFRAGLVRYLKTYLGYTPAAIRRCIYLRVMELTPGTSDDGHAHLHLWAVLPFVDKRVIAGLWWRALPFEYQQRVAWVPLKREGLAKRDELALRRRDAISADDCLAYPSVDVQSVHDDAVAMEIIKYLVKNRKEGDYIPADVEADLYMALEGRRAVAASRGFWTDRKAPAVCEHCGSVGEGFDGFRAGADGEHGLCGSDSLEARECAAQLRAAARAPPSARTSFLDTQSISARTREMLRDFDEIAHEHGTPDSSHLDRDAWHLGMLDIRSG